MDDLERRLRKARPFSGDRNAPLSHRARSDFARIAGQELPEGMENSTATPRRNKITTAATAALAVLACAAALVLFINPQQFLYVAEPETENTHQPPRTQEKQYEDVEALAEEADLVVQATVERSDTADGQVRSQLTVVETLIGSLPTASNITLEQPAADGDYDLPLAEVGADSLILFLSQTHTAGVYELVNASQSVLAVDGETVYPIFDELDLGSAETLAQIREHLAG
ncbi:hypothetical protein [Flaviflexus huanghaiensis]|uniref:hypothetical protein n=1 Tax=Flaviflexus huanghaiensis TaxID=1111473 RepID=UPI0015F9B096|nr:hypothetical protein [Flaviflexus huanghaiensis]